MRLSPNARKNACRSSSLLDLLGNPQACYRRADEPLRRALNRLLFDKLYLDEDGVAADELADCFRELVTAERPLVRRPADAHNAESPVRGSDGAQAVLPGTGPRTWSLAGPGSSNPPLVEVAGIEPASFGGLTGLLRAQLVMSLLGPTGLPSKPV